MNFLYDILLDLHSCKSELHQLRDLLEQIQALPISADSAFEVRRGMKQYGLYFLIYKVIEIAYGFNKIDDLWKLSSGIYY